jgi:biopolymer transport protein ExbB
MKRFTLLHTLLAALLLTASASFSSSVFAEEPVPAPVQATQTVQPTTVQRSAPSPVADKEVVENPYGLDALWKTGDVVAKSTLVILAFMSIGTWYIFVTKFYEQYKLGRQTIASNATFWSAGSVAQAVETLEVGSPYHFIAKSAQDALLRHEGLLAHIGLNAWITQSIQRSIDNVQSRLQEGLAFLGTVGATAPFIGLFGTVWGIYHALTAIGIAGQASIDKVAGPVGEALIMTAIGLFVAVPAVLGYNWLVRRNKAALEAVRAFGADLHHVLLGEAVASSGLNKESAIQKEIAAQIANDELEERSESVVKLNTNPAVRIVSSAFAS